MKQKISNLCLIVVIILLCTFIVLFSINYLSTDKTVIKSGREQKQSSNTLTLMYETFPETGEYQVSTDSTWPSNGYTFNSTLSKCENGSVLTYDATSNKVKVQSTKSDKCYVYFDKIPTFAETLIMNNRTIKMDHHTSTLANGANDGSYRFSGANPNNYVCFGPGATAAGIACPEDNQYRIIGVFGNQVKLIKKTSIGTRQWDNKGTNGDNTWSTSLINAYLNGEYLNNLTFTWINKIASNTWQVGGMTGENGFGVIAATAYTYEVGSNKENVTFTGKIGLMYVSDYGFAASAGAWSLKLYDNSGIDYRTSTTNNWLFSGNIHSHEWTIPRYLNSSYIVFNIDSCGAMSRSDAINSFTIRPSFYLQSLVKLNGGNGTQADPYRI